MGTQPPKSPLGAVDRHFPGFDELITRWPHAADERRIPMAAFSGASDDSTLALRDIMYLREVERQTSVFDCAFHDALLSALVRDDNDECWRHLQSALFAAIVVVRLVRPTDTWTWGGHTKDETKAIAVARAVRLRVALGLPEPGTKEMALYRLRKLRNAMEHVDERLDHIAEAASGSLSDWYLSGGAIFVRGDTSQTAPFGLRSFDPTAGVLVIDDQFLDLFQLDLDMLELRSGAAAAISRTQERVVGRCTFGGVRMLTTGTAPERLAKLRDWEAKRAKIVGAESTLEA